MSGKRMGRGTAAAAALAGTMILLLAAKPAPQAAGKKAPAKTAGEEFMNLKVLNNIPANQLFPTMHLVAHSLGVRCEFCHVAGDFASDAKPHKRRARQMMRMVEAINRNNFGGDPVVSCYTCHRGSPHPVVVPPLAATTDMPRAKMPAGVTAKSIYARYLAAIGGQAAVAQLPRLTVAGTAQQMNGQSAPVTAQWSAAGGTHWTSSAAEKVHGQLEAMQAQLIPALDLAAYPHLELNAPAKIDGQLTYRVTGYGPRGVKQVFFDAQTGLVRRVEIFHKLAIGMSGEGVDYSGYAPVHGVQVPRQIELLAPRSHSTIQITSVQPAS